VFCVAFASEQVSNVLASKLATWGAKQKLCKLLPWFCQAEYGEQNGAGSNHYSSLLPLNNLGVTATPKT
jgi:hypothetical protein